MNTINEHTIIKTTEGGDLTHRLFMKGGVLTLFSQIRSNLNVFQSLSILYTYLEYFTSRVCINEHTVIKTTKGVDLIQRLSIYNDCERITNICDSTWRYCTQNDERRRFNPFFANTIVIERLAIILGFARVFW